MGGNFLKNWDSIYRQQVLNKKAQDMSSPSSTESADQSCHTVTASLEDQYPPIGDYALIGDCRTAALVSSRGSMDWLCLPHFSGPAVFAALIDRERGGYFAVHPAGAFTSRRRYVPHTNVLETTFTTERGALRLTDCLPIVNAKDREQTLQPQREILRIVECLEGEVEVHVTFQPRPDFGRKRPRLIRRGALGWAAETGSEILMLHADLHLESVGDATLEGRMRMFAGQRHYISLTYAYHHIGIIPPLGEYAEGRCRDTVQWWREWCAGNTYKGPYADAVERSALTLKLLTFGLSGAIVAAPTTSLPSVIGGVRNWDYRYCWLRDAALTLSAFLEMGHPGEDEAFLGWLLHSTRLTWPRLQVLYDIYGETRLKERERNDLEGYRRSKPVRIGNGACDQQQLDVYGEVVGAAYDYVQRGGRLQPDEARLLCGFGRVVCKDWRLPDQGIWEFRDEGSHHTHSKLMCWVALDRLIRLHEQGHLKLDIDHARQERDAVRAAIEGDGFNEQAGTYVTTFGGSDVDASLLLMAQYGYKDASDPRLLATFNRIDRELGVDGLIYRYREGLDDFLPPGENPFVITSFWAVDYLARLGDRDRAFQRFERILSCANDLGLFAEEIEPSTGEARGNFPQAFSHVGLINAAFSLAALVTPAGPGAGGHAQGGA